MTSRTHDNFRHNFWTWVWPPHPVWTMLKKNCTFLTGWLPLVSCLIEKQWEARAGAWQLLMLERERKSVVIAEQAGAGVGHLSHPGHPVVQRKTGSCYCRASRSYEQPLDREQQLAMKLLNRYKTVVFYCKRYFYSVYLIELILWYQQAVAIDCSI